MLRSWLVASMVGLAGCGGDDVAPVDAGVDAGDTGGGGRDAGPGPNGSRCEADLECESGHCQNDFCCATGDCCAAPLDCPSDPSIAITCDDMATCQGTRGVIGCTDFSCVARRIDDDSACGTDILAIADCGAYPPLRCSGEPNQPPACASSCEGDGECVESAHCEAGTCMDDRPLGGACARVEDCTTGLACSDGVCCEGPCEGVCMVCNAPATLGTCVMATPVVELCNSDDDDCDTMIDEGFDLATDPAHCGMCGMVCMLPNATSICAAGMCAIESCDAGFADANADPADGCEMPLP